MKDTNDFINRIDDTENIPPNSYLVTMDVKTLNTNILNSERIAAVKNVYDNFDILDESLGIVSPAHFVYDFSTKMFLKLYSIN